MSLSYENSHISCSPEVVKNEPYGEKADVWAAGCILYQMATLNPPFYSTNMLSLATKIVGAVYEPVPDGLYSEKVSFTIKRCLTPDAETRPDIVEVSSLLSDVMMKYLDVLSTSHLMLEKKLDRERRRTQRYFTEANRNAAACQHQLSISPQNHYDKLRLQGSTTGTASCRSEFSENLGILAENCHSTCRKDEKRTYEEILTEDNSSLENSEKDLFSELDDELDVLDNSSSSSSRHLKESASGTNASLGTSERQPQIRACIEGLGSRLRPANSNKEVKYYYKIGTSEKASAGIAVSQRKVRQISDPVQQILIQLHKIIFITQLPPALQCSLKRRVIERFKKSLFSQQSNPCNLKSEMKKLLQGSPELIDTNFFTADWHMVLLSSSGNVLVPEDRKGTVGTSDIAEGMTYEQLQVYLLSNKELSSKRRELIILIKRFRTVSSEDKLPVFQPMLLISEEETFAHQTST
uniref:Protein kinase domain-containing protein n=1 Tax=Meleagris gallopavo TaxID=9103 RepID=A0A803YK86_MELGA